MQDAQQPARPAQETILIVDDVEINRAMLRMIFEQQYQIAEAENGLRALEYLQRGPAPGQQLVAILLDVVMPKLDGFGFLERCKQLGLGQGVPVVLITGDDSDASALKSYELGVADRIPKPFNQYVVRQRVQNIVDLYKHKNDLESQVAQQTRALAEKNRLLQENNIRLIDLMSSMVEFRDTESGEHIHRMKRATDIIARRVAQDHPEYGLTPDDVRVISEAAALHDIGKIAIPDSILMKPGRLTPEEFEVMKGHSLAGCRILDSVRIFDDEKYRRYGYDICRYHHERWDGRGYPDQLVGDEIPVAAQIVALADVYDALTSERVYKPAYTPEEAVHMILGGECGAFNPKMLDCLKKEQGALRDSLGVEHTDKQEGNAV